MKFLLTSAGINNHFLSGALESLTLKPLAETKVLFVTTAANTGHDDKRWLLDNLNEFAAIGVKSLDILDVAGLPPRLWQPHFEQADVICVGGGDERYLARTFTEIKMKEYLQTNFSDKVYVGISAGAMVLGKLLPAVLSTQLYLEENFGDVGGEGMELLDFSFVPHINSSFFSLRAEHLENMKDKFTQQVYATDDYTGLTVVDGEVSKVGEGVCLHYDVSPVDES